MENNTIIKIEQLEKSFGILHVLKGIDLGDTPWRGGVYHRRLRLRQVHAAALHQPP